MKAMHCKRMGPCLTLIEMKCDLRMVGKFVKHWAIKKLIQGYSLIFLELISKKNELSTHFLASAYTMYTDRTSAKLYQIAPLMHLSFIRQVPSRGFEIRTL